MATSRPRRMLIGAPFAFGVGSLLPACQSKRAPAGDPGAGRWPSLIGLPDPTFALPPPPPAGSSAAREELVELARRQSTRTAADLAAGRSWQRGASLAWNETARELVAQHRIDLIVASRVYALLGVAQHDACVGVFRNKYRYRRPPPYLVSNELRPDEGLKSSEPAYPCAHAAIAAASAAVLGELFPGDRGALQTRATAHAESRITLGASTRSDVEAGRQLGQVVGAAVVQHRRDDGADSAASEQRDLAGPGGWRPAPSRPPLGAHWGQVRPWVMPRAAQFRAPPPPALGSPAFREAVMEVRRYSDRADQEQARIAALWADGPGSYTPAGRWNKIAADLVVRHRLDEARAARGFALLNLALMDAGIACWDSKFFYAVLRPWQADPAIRTPVGTPNFPSYTSAHATFSGAAAGLLAHLFPKDRTFLVGKAEEAAMSRMYGGLHYRFDADQGLAQGRAIAQLVWTRRGPEASV
jgi:membrane-associated phospholipid phosphatase